MTLLVWFFSTVSGACIGLALGGYLQRPLFASVRRLIAAKDAEIGALNAELDGFTDDDDDTSDFDPDPCFSPIAMAAKTWDGNSGAVIEHRNP